MKKVRRGRMTMGCRRQVVQVLKVLIGMVDRQPPHCIVIKRIWRIGPDVMADYFTMLEWIAKSFGSGPKRPHTMGFGFCSVSDKRKEMFGVSGLEYGVRG